MANQRTTNKTTPPKKTTPTKKTMIGTSASDIAAQARAKAAELERRAKAMGWKTVSEYKNSGWAQNKSAFTKKPAPVKSTEVKVTTPKKLTAKQMSDIPFNNSTINKYSDKVYPIYQTPTAKNRRENTLNFAADAANNRKPFKEQEIMYGTKAQRDSSMASVYKRNIKNVSGTNLLVYPDKNNPYVAPGNTGAGPLVRRKFVTNNAQLRANKRLTGKTGDQ